MYVIYECNVCNVCMYVCTYVGMFIVCMYVCNVRMYVMYVCKYIYVCVCMYECNMYKGDSHPVTQYSGTFTAVPSHSL